MNDNSDDYEMDTFDNMDDMFQVTDDTDSIKDVFSEYGGIIYIFCVLNIMLCNYSLIKLIYMLFCIEF